MTSNRSTLEADLALARQNGDFAAEAACLLALGEIAKENEEYDLAQGLYGQAWAAYERVGDQRQTVQAILSLTDVYARLTWDDENFEAAFLARHFCDQALRIAEQAQDYAAQGRAMKVKADLMGHVFAEQAIKQSIYEQALKLCEQGDDLEGQADAMIELGFIYRHDHDDLTQAQSLFSRAVHLYHQANLYEQEARSLERLATIVNHRDNTVARKNSYKQALAIYEQLNELLEVARILSELGQIASQEKDYDLAIAYHKQELSLCDRYSEDPNGYTNALYSLGCVYEATKNYEEACFYYMKDLALCNKKDTLILASRSFSVARVYAALGDLNMGRKYAHQAIATSDSDPKYDDLFYAIWQRWRWGEIEYKAGFHEIGCALCYKAFDLAEEIPFGRHILDVWEQELAAMNCPPTETPSHDA